MAMESALETVGVPTGSIGYRLRAARAIPPAVVAANVERGRLFSSALEQFDDYMAAAEAVGPATRPLQLYYALASAGAAIVAAHGESIEIPASHGMKLDLVDELLDCRVRPTTRRGAFQAVAEACGHAPLTEPAHLGALAASLPELAETIDEERWSVALRAGPRAYRAHEKPVRYRGLPLVVSFEPWPMSAEVARERLEEYPTLAGGQITDGIGMQRLLSASGEFGAHEIGGVLLHYPGELPLIRALDARAPEYAIQGQRWVRPRIGTEVISPFLTWWLYLYALSMLSRYHPVAWTRALAIDESPIAADLEFALERAKAAIPRLVLGAIWGVNVVEIVGIDAP